MTDPAAPLLEQAGKAAQDHPGLAMLLLSAGTLVSEDLACITAGLLPAGGKLALPQGIMACALGIWLGDLGLYGLGAAARQGSGRWGWLARWVKPAHLLCARTGAKPSPLGRPTAGLVVCRRL